MLNDKQFIIPNPDSMAVGRETSFFAKDIQGNYEALQEAISGKKILVIGGAGSIGSNTINLISRFEPKSLHIVDQNENGLAEVVRNLRSREEGLSVEDFQTLPLNYGNPAFKYFLADNGPYDYVLSFAALKHVRSEKDPFSLIEMLNTNLILMSNLLEMLSEMEPPKRFFSVSTDKAANPSSMMGASKRLMEHFMFSDRLPRPSGMGTTSARFANVAYSNGSLLQSFHHRIASRQPLVSPRDCRRYFVSLAESGEICTLAAFLAPDGTIAIPNLNPEEHLILLEDVLFDFLKFKGLKPKVFDNEIDARAAVDVCEKQGLWPVLLTELNTAGEKPYEEFVGVGESIQDIGLKALSGVTYLPSSSGDIIEVRDHLKEIMSSDVFSNIGARNISKNFLRDIIASIEPRFLETHRDSKSNLDQRM